MEIMGPSGTSPVSRAASKIGRNSRISPTGLQMLALQYRPGRIRMVPSGTERRSRSASAVAMQIPLLSQAAPSLSTGIFARSAMGYWRIHSLSTLRFSGESGRESALTGGVSQIEVDL